MKPIAVLLADKNGYPVIAPIGKKYNPWRDPVFLLWVVGAIVTGGKLLVDWMIG